MFKKIKEFFEFNLFFRRNYKNLFFSGIRISLQSFNLKNILEKNGYTDFNKTCIDLGISQEEKEIFFKKIELDLENSEIKFKNYKSYDNWYGHVTGELYFELEFGKYKIFISCEIEEYNGSRMYDNSIKNLRDYCFKIEERLNEKNRYIIFTENFKVFEVCKIDYNKCYLVIGKTFISLSELNNPSFIFLEIIKYFKTIGKIILNILLFQLNKKEKKETEKALKNFKKIKEIIGTDFKISKEFRPIFDKVKRLEEINNQIKSLTSEIREIRKSI